jgi:hypothetical protein
MNRSQPRSALPGRGFYLLLFGCQPRQRHLPIRTIPIPNDATPKHMMMKQTVSNTLKSTMTEMLGSFATAIRTKSQYSAQTIPKTTKTMFLKDFILFVSDFGISGADALEGLARPGEPDGLAALCKVGNERQKPPRQKGYRPQLKSSAGPVLRPPQRLQGRPRKVHQCWIPIPGKHGEQSRRVGRSRKHDGHPALTRTTQST